MTADRARGALAVLQDADGKFICEVPCGYIVEQTASAHKPRRIQAQRRRRAKKRTSGCDVPDVLFSSYIAVKGAIQY